MEDYTKEDVIDALVKLDLQTRKRAVIDQKSYLISILAFKFKMPEYTIAKTCGLKRHAVNYGKRLFIQFHNDKSYLQNIYVYSQSYPFDFNTVTVTKPNRNITVELVLDKKFYNKLKTTGEILGNKDIRTTIKFLLEKSLKLWE